MGDEDIRYGRSRFGRCRDYTPPRRSMKEVKADFNKNLQKHALSKTKPR